MNQRDHTGAGRPPSLAQVAGAVGFRRIELVRVNVGATRTTAQATGVAHRYPRTVAISLSTAGRLVAAGAPFQVRVAPAEVG